jgi:hypothetical protein
VTKGSGGKRREAAVVFNPPPGWPPAPMGWLPPLGWEPPPEWPAVPDGWDFYLELPPRAEGASWSGPRATAPRYADPGYLPMGHAPRAQQKGLTSLHQVGERLFRSTQTRKRNLVVGGILALVGFSLVTYSSSDRNSVAVARQLCAPAIAEEIADRLEVPGSEVVEIPSSSAGAGTPRIPPRAPITQRARQAAFVSITSVGTAVLAEGNYRARDNTRWLFSCTVDVTDAPVVTRVAVSPTLAEQGA